MEDFFQENKKAILIAVCVLALFPAIISVAMFISFFKFSKGDANSWLSFWGSYFGGIFSGVMTFLGVFMAFKLERENNKKNQAGRNYNKTFELFRWINDVLQYFNQDKTESSLSYLYDQGSLVLDGLADVDSEWYLEAKYIQSEIFDTWIYKANTIENKREDIKKLHKDVNVPYQIDTLKKVLLIGYFCL